MKRTTLSLILLLTAIDPLAAQYTVDEALADYNFPKAESLINAEITKLRRKKQSTEQLEEQLEYVQKAMSKMGAVERVVVFDSLVLHRDSVLSALCLSPESGRIMPTTAFPGIQNGGQGTLFRSEMGDKVYYSALNSAGVQQLFTGDMLDGVLSDVEPLSGLDDEPEDAHNFPYMMADGETLYFAAQGEESLGGYDIFMTRYDADDHRFLSPENVGMPFNSPANDYLLCIDEAYNIGCFVTDRNMPPDTVCVYYFLPNSTRRVYFEEEVGEEALRGLARLSDIRQTWGVQSDVTEAKQRLKECHMTQDVDPEADFTFLLPDGKAYHWLSDFRNSQAKKLAQQWLQDKDRLAKSEESLDEMRETYSQANTTKRKLLQAQILKMEGDKDALVASIKKQENAIIKAELGE